MTINIALVTNEALILGCDSIASKTAFFLDPFGTMERSDEGEPTRDADGNFVSRYAYKDIKEITVAAWSGVTKMFPIHTGRTNVAAVTSGLAGLSGQNIATLANEFCENPSHQLLDSVEQIAGDFLKFLRDKFDLHYADSSLPEQFWQGPEFLIGGCSLTDPFPSLFKLDVKANRLETNYAPGSFGLAWNAQADAVERLLFGWDTPVRMGVEAAVLETLAEYRDKMHERIIDILNRALPGDKESAGFDLGMELPPVPEVRLPWDRHRLPIDFANLPIQAAVDLVAFLVLTQSGRARFAEGIATVGGRIHIGVVRKGEPFQMLDEPRLEHRYRGFGDAI